MKDFISLIDSWRTEVNNLRQLADKNHHKFPHVSSFWYGQADGICEAANALTQLVQENKTSLSNIPCTT